MHPTASYGWHDIGPAKVYFLVKLILKSVGRSLVEGEEGRTRDSTKLRQPLSVKMNIWHSKYIAEPSISTPSTFSIRQTNRTREVTELSLPFHDGKPYTLMSWRTEYFSRLKLICTQVCVVTALFLIHCLSHSS